jgi:hypothetical protein
MKLVWHPTGDEVDLVPINGEVLEYYHQQITAQRLNSFSLGATRVNLSWLEKMQQLIADVAPPLQKARQPQFMKFVNTDLYDQQVLNELHKEYVLLGRQFNVRQFMGLLKFDPTVMEQINTLIHDVEEMWAQEWNNNLWMNNPFPPSLVDFEDHNVYLEYQDFGRHQWECYLQGVTDTADLSNYANLGSTLNVTLHRPLKWAPPSDYVEWCNQHGLQPIGRRLNLADIKDLDKNKTELRKLFARNTCLTMSIEI